MASSWKLLKILELVKGPMRHWRRLTTEPGCRQGYVRKEKTWLTLSKELAAVLSQRCSGELRHVHLAGGDRSALASMYPPALVRAVLLGFKRQLQKDKDEYDRVEEDDGRSQYNHAEDEDRQVEDKKTRTRTGQGKG